MPEPKSPQKRDRIAELKSYANRSDAAFEKGFPDWERLEEIIGAYVEIDTLDSESVLRPELHRHIIVSLAAVIQSAARSMITDIVDEKELRGEELPELRDVKLTLDLALELKNHSFSFGELVAHFSAVSSVKSLSESFKHICDHDLAGIMKLRFLDKEPRDRAAASVGGKFARFRERLLKLFEYRIIFADEEGHGTTVSAVDLVGFIRVSM